MRALRSPYFAVFACVFAGTLYMAAQLQTADLAAQTFRADLFKEIGFSAWNTQWYGGHHLPAYSVIFPPLAAAFGPRAGRSFSRDCSSGCVHPVSQRICDVPDPSSYCYLADCFANALQRCRRPNAFRTRSRICDRYLRLCRSVSAFHNGSEQAPLARGNSTTFANDDVVKPSCRTFSNYCGDRVVLSCRFGQPLL